MIWMVAVRFFIEHGFPPNEGGLFDQDLRFFIAMQVIAPEISKKIQGAFGGGPKGLSGMLGKMGRQMGF